MEPLQRISNIIRVGIVKVGRTENLFQQTDVHFVSLFLKHEDLKNLNPQLK